MSGTFHQVLAANPATPSLLRRAFRRWLDQLGWPGEHIDPLVLALNEAVSNAVEHAYPDSALDRQVWVRAELTTTTGSDTASGSGDYRQVVLQVADSGRWRPYPVDPSYRGRGLAIMRACAELLDIDPSPEGTRVRMLSRPVHQDKLSPAVLGDTRPS
jgi:anti-sigma regulatory factor (Ser/Thr protein kinase)